MRNISGGSFGHIHLVCHRDTGTDVTVKVLKEGKYNSYIKTEYHFEDAAASQHCSSH
jgi:serine/threonine protein kinase